MILVKKQFIMKRNEMKSLLIILYNYKVDKYDFFVYYFNYFVVNLNLLFYIFKLFY